MTFPPLRKLRLRSPEYLIRRPEGEHLEGSARNLEAWNLTEKELVGKTSHELPWAAVAEQLDRIDHELKTGRKDAALFAMTFLHPEHRLLQVGVAEAQHYDGVIVARGELDPQEYRNAWIGHLDFARQRLNVDGQLWLKRKELRVLHLYIHGATYEYIAAELHMSVHNVSSIIKRVRDRFSDHYHESLDTHRLFRRMNDMGLFEFIIKRPDWFSTVPELSLLA